jgi:GNAT superfamily N-acetyltransferase
MAVTWRIAEIHDAAAIRDVVRAAYARWIPVIGREPRPMQADYDTAVHEHRFDLIEDNGRLVALIETEPRDGHFWIENIAVLPESQGRGLGHQLLRHAEALALDHGLREIRLLTNGKMQSNRKLYVSIGYVEDLEEPWGDGTVVHLSKKL